MRLAVLSLSLAVFLGFVGCDKEEDPTPPDWQRSYLHILGAAPALDSMNIVFDYYNADDVVISGFFYKRNWPISGYADLQAGGTPDDFGNNRLFISVEEQDFVNGPNIVQAGPKAIVLAPDERSTICIADSAGQMVITKYQDNAPDMSSGVANLRFINLNDGQPLAGIQETNGGFSIANIEFLAASDYVQVAPGTYTVEVTDDAGGVIGTTNAFLTQGVNHTFYLSGTGNGDIDVYTH